MDINAFSPYGYDIHKNKKDVFGKSHKFCVSPANGSGGGGINYFDSITDMETFLYQVKANRLVQSGKYDEAARINLILRARITGEKITDILGDNKDRG